MRNLITILILAVAVSAFAQGPTYPYSVPNNWTASKDPVAGYNLYRAIQTGTNCGAWTKVNSNLIAATNFVDGTVADETTYCYTATAVDSQGRESGISNVVQNLVIPPAPPTGFGSQVAHKGSESTVTFSWAQSKDPSIKTNDIYAGKKTGGPYNAAHVHLPAGNQYVYKNAPKGTYFAIVTATAKTESGRSNETKIIIQ